MASILVVEGSIAVREMVRFTLTRAGHAVTEMPDAQKVLRLIDRRKFDVIFTSVSLPGTNDIDRVQSLRGVPVCRLATPFDSGALLELLDRILRTRPRRLQLCLV
ncbi:MAG TPA: response regulator [Burkholderiales bacterium]|jgi:DNA-binding response OmpR family regulator|nr:response regulator [Burkholderiales bacterium]